MKYLFINSVAGFGSTGRIILSACERLEQQGHTCRIAYGRQATQCGVPTIAIGSPWDYRFHALCHRIFGTGGFGSRAATARFLRQVREYDPDVIWLHNLHGYYIHVGKPAVEVALRKTYIPRPFWMPVERTICGRRRSLPVLKTFPWRSPPSGWQTLSGRVS